MLEGMMARPRATSERTNSAVTNSGTVAPKLSPSASAAGARPFELRKWLTAHPAQRLMHRGEGPGEMLTGDVAVVLGFDVAALIGLNAAALAHPLDAGTVEPPFNVDGRVGIR